MTSLKRVIRSGWQGFSRNVALSAATISIMAMVIILGTLLFLMQPANKALISELQEKIDISVYFKEDIQEDDIMDIKSDLSQIPEVREVSYVSEEEALEIFKETHSQDSTLIDSLAELGDNPFLASLNIKTWQASQYEQIAKLLEGSSFNAMIDKVDYYERKPVIERISSIASAINKIGIFLSFIIGIIALLVAFNAIKIAIYNSNQEISVMKLVGASNWFVRGPFLVQGIIIGFFAALISLLITFALSFALSSKIKLLAPEINLFGLFLGNFLYLFFIQLAIGIGLGILSSFIAVRKYLRV